MAKEPKNAAAQPVGKYRRVQIADLDRGRRGKHHDLVEGILEELEIATPGSALEIPLADVGGVGLANWAQPMGQAGDNLNGVDDRQAECARKIEVKIAVIAGRDIPKYAHICGIGARIRDDVELLQ